MTIYSYGLSAGHNVASPTNVETIVTHAPIGERVPLGPVRRRTLDGRTQFNGRRIIRWRWGAISRSDMNALLTNAFGASTSEGSAAVTINTPNHLDVYQRYNAYMVNPQPGEDWRRESGGALVDLEIEFVIVQGPL